MTFREYLQRAIFETFDLWDIVEKIWPDQQKDNDENKDNDKYI